MEGLKSLRVKAIAVGVCFAVIGAAFQVTPRPVLPKKTEKQMEEMAPMKVGKFDFVHNSDEPAAACSYRVDKRTYDLLKPFGVVGRIYSDGGEKTFDVLLIAGNDKNSFHDNRICFSGQGFNIVSEERIDIPTDRGVIPATYLNMKHSEFGALNAIMFFKGPHGKFFPLSRPLTWAMFVEEWKLGKDLDSVFYRIIPKYPNATKEELVDFVQQYMKAAQKSSGGFY